MNDAKVEQAIRLLISASAKEMSLKDAVGLIELVTNVPELIRETLKIAEDKGLLEKKSNRFIIKRDAISDLTWPRPKVKRVLCVDNCKKCGRRIGVCNYIVMEDTTYGPFGSECLRKLKIAFS